MKVALKIALPIGLALASGSALAVDFGTTAFIDGTAYTIGAAGSPVQRLGDSISFSLPNGIAITAPKTIVLKYGVSADPGLAIKNVTQIGTGQATGSSTAVFTTIYGSGSVTQTNNAGAAFPAYTYTFPSLLHAYGTVTTNIVLTPVNGIAKASAFTANYTQAVPEPITIGAMVVGLAGLVRRKRK